MKTLAAILSVAVWLTLAPPQALAAPEPAATITRIAVLQDEVTVTVWVPAGSRRVTLESRPRLGRGSWTPRDVKWTDGTAGEITFKLPAAAAEAELLRVREEAEAELGLPAAFFQGIKTFAPVVQVPTSGGFQGGVINFDTPGLGTVFNPGDTVTELNPAPTRAVVESDIWKVEGKTIYFFNQFRGLQVIDVTDPDAPTLRGTLPLAEWGEQMYRLPADTGDGTVWLALLTQSGCDGNSEVLLVAVRNGQPTLHRRLPLIGSLQESRLVGHALYAATYSWFQPAPVPDSNGTGYIYQPALPRTVVAGFDLADPRQPTTQPAVELAATPNAISATDRWLFVATTGSRTPSPTERLPFWAVAGNQAVHVFDLADPHGSVRQTGVLPTEGRVDSKFKLGLNGDVLTVVSEAGNTGRMVTHEDPATGKTWEEWTWLPPRAVLETFTLANPAQPERLAGLTLINNQSVYGTRFDGNRVYVVTFLRVDPLWIVDLSDPANPRVQGKLEVPGWSNYLLPQGDQLLAVGVEGGRAALSLFDVKDAAKPALLSKALLGDGWSWTEANNDEKALTVLPEAGLLLMPWSGQQQSASSGWFSGMQLVDYERAAGSLIPRGVISHNFQARRATLIGERVVSLSGDALLSVEITDRDQPSVRATLPLTHQADRVLVAGDRLLQLQNGATPTWILTRTSAPETALATLPLVSLPVVGSAMRGDRLYVQQHRPESWRSEETRVTNAVVTQQAQPPRELRSTNLVVVVTPQPPLTNLLQVWREVTYPPTPETPSYTTNKWVWRLEITPQPDLVTTNAVVRVEWIPQPDRLTTNEVVSTEWRSILIPAESVLSVIGFGGDALQLLGQDRTPLPAGVWGSLVAVWPAPETLVWTETAGGSSPFWLGGLMLVDGGGISLFATGDQAVFELPFGGWWQWWGGASSRHLVAFNVAEPQPRWAAAETLTTTNGWSQFSPAFAAEGKVFVGERSTEWITVTTATDPAKPGQPSVEQLWQHTHRLHVVDFADASAPVVRPPLAVSGELLGLSHGGQLVYTRLNGSPALGQTAATPERIQALAYDGLSASLVDSLEAGGPTGAAAVLVRDNGQVLVSRAALTDADAARIEAWAVTGAGRFAQQGSLAAGSPVASFHDFGDVVLATTGSSFLFLSAGGPETLSQTGFAERPCSLWSDFNTADASADTGLWLARGTYGLWHVPAQP